MAPRESVASCPVAAVARSHAGCRRPTWMTSWQLIGAAPSRRTRWNRRSRRKMRCHETRPCRRVGPRGVAAGGPRLTHYGGVVTARGAAARFLADSLSDDVTVGCREWPYARDPHNYGRVKSDGKMRLAHRAVWVLARGPIPPDTPDVLHSCDNPPCVLLSHLFLGSHADNMRDCKAKGRQSRVRGTDNGRSKLTPRQVQAIRTDPRPLRTIGAQFGITHKVVGKIKAGTAWGWL